MISTKTRTTTETLRRRATEAGDMEAREAAHVQAMTSRLAARRIRPAGLPDR